MSGVAKLRAKHMVLDSNAFIRNVSVTDFGEIFYTVPEVIAEIRDQQTRDRLQVLPYKLETKTPTPESIMEVTEFAKRTGDYQVLSLTDLKVIALTLELHRQFNGDEILREAPKRAELHNTAELQNDSHALPPGWYVPHENELDEWNSGETAESNQTEEDTSSHVESTDDDHESAWITLQNIDSLKMAFDNLTVKTETPSLPGESDAVDEDGEEDLVGGAEEVVQSDTEEKKIDTTESQTAKVPVKNSEPLPSVPADQQLVPVTCLTGDYAMQNVLLQIGLRVFGVKDGHLSVIRETRNYVLRCTACSCVTTDMTKRFCPDCGNHSTLRRVVKKVLEDGRVELYIAAHRPLNARGLRYCLVQPRGGKHNSDPIVAADQPRAQERAARRAKQRIDAMAVDYGAANDNPFSVHDLDSRAARHGVTRRQDEDGKHLLPSRRRNPNESRKRRK